MLKSKIHCATVTEANLHYMGSITIDEALMEATGMLEGEQVHVVNNSNGERIVTYIIKGERNSGVICLNGAAAHKFQPGDIISTLTYDVDTVNQSLSTDLLQILQSVVTVTVSFVHQTITILIHLMIFMFIPLMNAFWT